MKLVKRLVVAVALIALAVPVIAQIRFPDVPDDHPRAVAIRWAAEQEFYKGFPDGSFRPDDELTESQFIKTARRLYERYDSWTRADWAQVLYAGVPSLQTTTPAPTTTTRPATTTTTTTTTTRPATTTTAPTTTRESVIYYAARGAEWAARAAEYRPNDIYRDRERAVIAYELAAASYGAACGALYAAGLHPIAIYMRFDALTAAVADGFTENPDAAAYAAVRGYCGTGSLYGLAADSLRRKTPIGGGDGVHDFGNARHPHEFVALAPEYAEIGVAGLRAINHLITGDYDLLLSQQNALVAKHDFLNYEYDNTAKYATDAAAMGASAYSGTVIYATDAAIHAAELADSSADSATTAARIAAKWVATARASEHAAYVASAVKHADLSRANAHAAADAAEWAATAAEYAAEYAAEWAAHAAEYATEWEPTDSDNYELAYTASVADAAAADYERAAAHAAHAAEWAARAERAVAG